MVPSLFQSTSIPMLEQVVNFTQARHGVLAGNIANIDTPGYKTRDLSPELFQERLKAAVESSRTNANSTYADSEVGGAADVGELDAFQEVQDSLKDILYHDESDVSMERQIAEISKNQAQHNLAISVMSAQFRLLRAAVTERVT